MNCPRCHSTKTRMMVEAPDGARFWVCGNCDYQWKQDPNNTSLTSQYRDLTQKMLKEGIGSTGEIEKIKREYHDFAVKEDFEKVAEAMKEKFGAELDTGPDYHFFDLYRRIPEALNAKVIVETGTGAGGSCGKFVEAAKKTRGRVYSIDNYPDHISIEICKERHLSQEDPVTFIIGDSIEEGKKWNKGNIDVLYLDSGHEFDFVMEEIEVWGRHNPKVIMVHDTLEADAGTQGTPIIPLTMQAPYWVCKLHAEKQKKTFIHVGCCFTGLGVII